MQIMIRLTLQQKDDFANSIISLFSLIVALFSNPKEYLDNVFEHFPNYPSTSRRRIFLTLGLEHPEGIKYASHKEQDRDMVSSGYTKIPRVPPPLDITEGEATQELTSPTTLLTDESLTDPKRLNHFTIGLTNPHKLYQSPSSPVPSPTSGTDKNRKRKLSAPTTQRKRVETPKSPNTDPICPNTPERDDVESSTFLPTSPK